MVEFADLDWIRRGKSSLMVRKQRRRRGASSAWYSSMGPSREGVNRSGQTTWAAILERWLNELLCVPLCRVEWIKGP